QRSVGQIAVVADLHDAIRLHCERGPPDGDMAAQAQPNWGRGIKVLEAKRRIKDDVFTSHDVRRNMAGEPIAGNGGAGDQRMKRYRGHQQAPACWRRSLRTRLLSKKSSARARAAREWRMGSASTRRSASAASAGSRKASNPSPVG